jgi:hypothetical protein
VGQALFLRREQDDLLVQALETAAIALVTLMGYLLIRNLFHTGDAVLQAKTGIVERSLGTNLFFAFGIGLLLLDRFAF